MENPLSLVKNSRTVWNKELERPVVEVLVELNGAPKSWIPLELLVALANLNQNERTDQTYSGTSTN
jgi:hypothetical protein